MTACLFVVCCLLKLLLSLVEVVRLFGWLVVVVVVVVVVVDVYDCCYRCLSFNLSWIWF